MAPDSVQLRFGIEGGVRIGVGGRYPFARTQGLKS